MCVSAFEVERPIEVNERYIHVFFFIFFTITNWSKVGTLGFSHQWTLRHSPFLLLSFVVIAKTLLFANHNEMNSANNNNNGNKQEITHFYVCHLNVTQWSAMNCRKKVVIITII